MKDDSKEMFKNTIKYLKERHAVISSESDFYLKRFKELESQLIELKNAINCLEEIKE